MDAFKGVFRRANQAVKEKTGRAEATADHSLEDAVKRVRLLEKQGMQMMEKVNKLNQLFEEIGTTCSSMAEDYKATLSAEHSAPEMAQLTEELIAFGVEVRGKAQELSRNLKENAYDNVAAFVRDVPQLKNMEEDRKKKQLEFDFFRNKVDSLIKDPPKDSTRIPRNESIRENWRTQLWQSTEAMKASVSGMASNGQRCLDASLYTVAMTLGNYAGYALNSAKNHFATARIPAYSTAPLLPPTPLPPSPPPYQPQMPQGYPGGPPPGHVAPGAPAYASPQHGQYGTASYGAAPPGYASPQQQHPGAAAPYGTAAAGGAASPGGWNNNTHFGGAPAAPPQQPAQVNYGYTGYEQQQQQHAPVAPAAAPAPQPWGGAPAVDPQQSGQWAPAPAPQQAAAPAAAPPPWG